MNLRPLMLMILALSPILAESTRSTAFFNPRISAREIAFNQTVRIAFTTLRPQIDNVDPKKVVNTALGLPSVTDNWRVVDGPTVTVDEKIKTLRISYGLQPRVSGNLALPSIPARWLEGDQVCKMGSVEVTDTIAVGSETRPVPGITEAVAGFAWSLRYQDILQQVGQESGRQEGDAMVITVSDSLDLIVHGGLLGEARLTAKGLPLNQARHSFVDRWGPVLEDDPENNSLRWVVGWIRIEATDNGESTVVTAVHEGVENRVRKARVQQQVFDLLETGPSGSNGTPSSGVSDTAPATPAAPAAPAAPGQDYDKAFEEAMKRHREAVAK